MSSSSAAEQERVVVEVGIEVRAAVGESPAAGRRATSRHERSRSRAAPTRPNAVRRIPAPRKPCRRSPTRSMRSAPCRRGPAARAPRAARTGARRRWRSALRIRAGGRPSRLATSANGICGTQVPGVAFEVRRRVEPVARRERSEFVRAEMLRDLVALPDVEAALFALGVGIEAGTVATFARFASRASATPPSLRRLGVTARRR